MPFVLFLLGAAAVALVASQSKATPKNGGRTYTLDTSLPPQLRQQVLAALATEKDAGRLLAFAAQCGSAGYPLAAAALTQRAVELGGMPQPLPQPGPQLGPQPQPGPVNPVDPGLLPDPPRSQVLAALTTGIDPAALEALAQQMDAQGYTYAAQALRLKEAALRSMPAPVPVPTPQPQPGPAPQPAPAPQPSPFSLDPTMPAAMQSAVLGALTTEQDPAKLQAFAQEIQAQYPIAAGLLMAKANALRVQPNPFPPQPGPGPGPMPVPPAAPTTAVVTTRDPPPLGDLKVFDWPNGTQIGGVDKDAAVSVLQWNADGANQWARIAWAGGARRKAAAGYVHQAYLRPVAASPVSAGPPSAALAVRKGGANGLATHA